MASMRVDFRYVWHRGRLFQVSLNASSTQGFEAHSSVHSNPSNNQQHGPPPPSSSKPVQTMVRTDVLIERLETLVANRSLYLRPDVAEQENLPPPETKQRCTRCRRERPISWFYKAPARNPCRAAALQHQDAPNPPLRQLKACRLCRRDSTTYQAQKKRQRAAPLDTDPRQTERCDLNVAREQLKDGYVSNSSGVRLTR
jgi:hypothetical protein